MICGSFKNVIYKICLEIMYLIYMCKKDLPLNNQQWLICYKTKQKKKVTDLISNDDKSYA